MRLRIAAAYGPDARSSGGTADRSGGYRHDGDARRIVTLVGDYEAEAGDGRIGWNSPLARALRGAAVGDLRIVQLPAGPKEWEVMAVRYP